MLNSLKEFNSGIKRGMSRSRTKKRVQEKVLLSKRRAQKSI